MKKGIEIPCIHSLSMPIIQMRALHCEGEFEATGTTTITAELWAGDWLRYHSLRKRMDRDERIHALVQRTLVMVDPIDGQMGSEWT
jgi:phage terminase large subunit GpA-like protein